MSTTRKLPRNNLEEMIASCQRDAVNQLKMKMTAEVATGEKAQTDEPMAKKVKLAAPPSHVIPFPIVKSCPNDTRSGALQSTDHEWNDGIEQLLFDLTGTATFRTSQREAINAALLGHDTVIIMQTGESIPDGTVVTITALVLCHKVTARV